jgi:hypothetical protein
MMASEKTKLNSIPFVRTRVCLSAPRAAGDRGERGFIQMVHERNSMHKNGAFLNFCTWKVRARARICRRFDGMEPAIISR